MSAVTKTMRDILIDHMDGKAIRYRIRKGDTAQERTAHWAKLRAIASLKKLGHLQRGRAGYSVITDKGRALLAWLLADYAEALLRAGSVTATVQEMMESALIPKERLIADRPPPSVMATL